MRWFRKKRKENIIFLHLPKAGGTTLRHIFYAQYKYLKSEEVFTINRTKQTADFYTLPQTQKDKIKLLIGHFPFGLHTQLKGDFRYVTFMRNPVDRVISAYYYNKEKQNSDVYDQINHNKLSLKEYLHKDIEPWSANAMTKHIGGCSLSSFSKPCTNDIFSKAEQNLKSHFIAVGITERFDESLILLQDKLNWTKPKYVKKNVTKSKKNKSEIDSDTIDLIKEINQYDIELYKLGKNIFNHNFNQRS